MPHPQMSGTTRRMTQQRMAILVVIEQADPGLSSLSLLVSRGFKWPFSAYRGPVWGVGFKTCTHHQLQLAQTHAPKPRSIFFEEIYVKTGRAHSPPY